MRISVIGAGYVGLVQAAVLANAGHDVFCADINKDRIMSLNAGECPIYEPGLSDMIVKNRKANRLSFSTDISQVTRFADVVFICVGTPPQADGSPNMIFIKSASQMIARGIDRYKIVVNKSTSPVGTARFIKQTILEEMGDKVVGFDVVSNPEFLREGSAIEDSTHGDRIIVGADSWNASASLMALYESLNVQIMVTDIESAEMIKYASNAFLATKISFINTMADICERVGANVEEVARGMGMDQRIGKQFLKAGLGYGGSCFGKDVDAFIALGDELDEDVNILKAVREVNRARTGKFISKIREQMSSLHDRNIAVLGLAFKPNTDDMRDAKSIEIINQMINEGAFVRAYDPVAIPRARHLLNNVTFFSSPYDACEDADAVVIVTEWPEFLKLDWKMIKDKMRDPVIFDGRNIFEREEIEKFGFTYHSIGR